MLWIGAYLGDRISMANVIRICARYDNLDIVEDRYGISLRGLLNLSEKYYKEDPCKEFLPKLSKDDELKYSEHEILQIARMHKAMAIIQFKLEKQVIDKNPEFNLQTRALLDKIDFDKKTVVIRGKVHPMKSCDFPTIDRKNPFKLTKDEEKVVNKLRESFVTSEKLKKHIELFINKGAMYFERYFIEDKATHEEVKNAYYKLRENEEFCVKLLKEFGLTKDGHIINGHTPVKETKGEDPIKANGRTIVIDGGMSRAYHKTTGHGGYTLTYNSYGLQIMSHDIFQSKKKALKDETDIVSTRRVVDKLTRKKVADTDNGAKIKKQIDLLKLLLDEYRKGTIVERY